MSDAVDVVIVGAGIAGASLAYELAADHRVVLLEREDRPGYHSTGRSAAMLIATYGTSAVRRLTRASRPFFEAPPEGFSETRLLSKRGYLHLARDDQLQRLAAFEEEARPFNPHLERLDREGVLDAAPLIDPAYPAAGVLEPDAMAIDDAALHQGYLRGFARCGGQLVTGADVLEVNRAAGGGWRLESKAGRIQADTLVNAAGAWGDELAALAGVSPIGLQPKRRTAILLDPPNDHGAPAGMPMVTDIDDDFYVKPEGDGLMVSPADETPVAPSDAQPEELDVAITVDRYERLTGQAVKKIRRRWAGLRSFLPDHSPVIGVDPDVDGFFWLVGQGGFGIMTAPGAAQLSADLIRGGLSDDEPNSLAAAVSPQRFRRG
jgi:D-arginine dehydrogenase